MMEFHVSRQSRDRYQFDQTLFTLNGNVIFANLHGSRLFAQKMNDKRDLVNFPERAVKAGQINAMGLMDEILHLIVNLYRKQQNPLVMTQALEWLSTRIGSVELEKTLQRFINEFPPVEVYRRETSASAYLEGSTDGTPNRAIALEEMLMLWIANKNPAFSSYSELFDDSHLQGETVYLKVIRELHDFFDTQPVFGPDQQNLIDMLRNPAELVPHSLTGQLEYARTRWSGLLGRFLYRLLSGLDLIKEEEKAHFTGSGPIAIPIYGLAGGKIEGEAENFSPDKEWMPNLVLIAKNSYVWLDQLSKKYQREITRLDQIPDEELDILANWGFSGLWLIGLWERSQASAKIKQLCGNPEAISSAYSLAGYQIAGDLGGEEAYRNLRDRAFQRGIRLASDMVPNHMGIDSDWVIHHPEWFVSVNYSPFPSYEFNGPDLSPNGQVSINIEDHYFSRTDAAVVFKRYDHNNGQVQYIYHGNDGTSMPWNDTAQLNYLNPEVREAVIQTILDVARKFPIIRFDAAMTLAKHHYQRLWYPEPGSGGDIPSRAGMGLTKEQFDAIMPIEFWREVVDRAAVEAPDTLLLAEAFWLMEGYFVRTLGMHRVYNSAFMNLLRNEDNANYRLVMKNTLEFDPEILKRYVNFMNNPDERTAVDQFGKGDKYFGICTLMATLPGLPMFGHGQIEGFTEKYGMEFRKAYWEEAVDVNLIQRHEREIFPILHMRPIFAGVENFLLYNFTSNGGQINEDVFAYSNGLDSARALVVFHNRFANAQGWIHNSVNYLDKSPSGSRNIAQKTLSEGLNLHPTENSYVIFRDQISGLQYIRSGLEIANNGIFVNLDAYKFHVFTDFSQIQDDAWGSYRQVNELLNGVGVPGIDEALKELILRPVQEPFRQIANPGYFDYLLKSRLTENIVAFPDHLFVEAEHKYQNLLFGMEVITGQVHAEGNSPSEFSKTLYNVLSIKVLETIFVMPITQKYVFALNYLNSGFELNENRWLPVLTWVFLHDFGKAVNPEHIEDQSISWIDEWQFNKILETAYQTMGIESAPSVRLIANLHLIISQQRWYKNLGLKTVRQILEKWLADPDKQRFLGINRYQNILWFDHESFVEFVWWMTTAAILDAFADPQFNSANFVETVLGVYDISDILLQAEKESGYQVSKLLDFCEYRAILEE